MGIEPVTDTVIDDIVDAEAQDQPAALISWLIPSALAVVALILVVPALLSLGLGQLPMVIVTTASAFGTLVAARRLTQVFIRMAISRSPLVRAAPGAIEAIEQIAASGTDESAVLSVLHDQIRHVIRPVAQWTTLYDAHSQAYRRTDRASGLSSTDAFVDWVTRQPVATPITDDRVRSVFAGSSSPELPAAVVPLGRPGWISLGLPEDQARYDAGQLALLQAMCKPAALAVQHIALVAAERSRARELQALYWIAQAVNFATDADTLLELIYTQLKRVIRVPVFGVALLAPDDNTLSYRFYVENDKRMVPEETWSVKEGLTSVILANNATLRTEDYAGECRRRGVDPVRSIERYAWMGVALTAEDRSMGVMIVSTSSPEVKFTQAEENLLVTVAAYTAAILERQQLYNRLNSRARQLATLNAIGNLLASSLDLDEVLDLVVRNAAELLDTQAGSLLLLDEESGDLVFRVSSGPSGKDLVGMRVPAGKGIAGAAFSENRPIISQDTQEDKRWYAGFDQRSTFVTNSILAVPLNARGRTIGVLEVLNRKGGRPFEQEDAEFLLSFGAPAAIAIENARLFTTTDQALQASVQELMMLQYIDRQLNASLDYDAVMQQTLEWALNITDATVGMMAALQEDEDGTQGLRLLAHQGYDPEDLAPYLEDELWPLSRGLIGFTVRQGETTLVTDVGADPHYHEVQQGMTAQLTVPIRREIRVIGALCVESADAGGFGQEHVALVERLVDHAAIAIENARLFERVQQANDAKTEFISFVSHELKQPMTSMKGYSDLLIKGVGGSLNEQQTQFVQVVKNNIGRMDRLVQDLLDISRIEAGRLKLDMGPVAPAKVIEEAVQAFRQEITAKDQHLTIKADEDLPSVTGDRGRLIQVLTNLISNANKYTPEGGQITVSAEVTPEDDQTCVKWSVKDTGIGMSPDEVEQLFTKYFRSTRSAVRNVQGTGLGLVITRSIVEMHGGTISVESEAGAGSTFSFTAPLTEA